MVSGGQQTASQGTEKTKNIVGSSGALDSSGLPSHVVSLWPKIIPLQRRRLPASVSLESLLDEAKRIVSSILDTKRLFAHAFFYEFDWPAAKQNDPLTDFRRTMAGNEIPIIPYHVQLR